MSNESKNNVSEQELKLINKYSRKKLGADDVYTFSVVLCDNDVDRDNEYFSDSALDDLAKMFVGVTGIFDHDPSAENQVARIYDCKAEYVQGKTTVYGAPYKHVTAKAYIPICKSSEELIAMLDSGIKKEVSVGCGIAKCTCSICGEDMRIGACSHRKGKHYDGRLCCGVLNEPTDAYEWSFRDVPAQRRAGVVKSCGAKMEENHSKGGNQMTNADRIREMTDEELYELLSPSGCKRCAWKDKVCIDNKEMNCFNGLLQWLKQEVEEEP